MLPWQEPRCLPNSSTSPIRGTWRLPNPSTSDVTTAALVHFLWARTQGVTVDLCVMAVEFARKSLGWMVVWSTVLRRERSAVAAG